MRKKDPVARLGAPITTPATLSGRRWSLGRHAARRASAAPERKGSRRNGRLCRIGDYARSNGNVASVVNAATRFAMVSTNPGSPPCEVEIRTI